MVVVVVVVGLWIGCGREGREGGREGSGRTILYVRGRLRSFGELARACCVGYELYSIVD